MTLQCNVLHMYFTVYFNCKVQCTTMVPSCMQSTYSLYLHVPEETERFPWQLYVIINFLEKVSKKLSKEPALKYTTQEHYTILVVPNNTIYQYNAGVYILPRSWFFFPLPWFFADFFPCFFRRVLHSLSELLIHFL